MFVVCVEVEVPENVSVDVRPSEIFVKGQKGEVVIPYTKALSVSLKDNKVVLDGGRAIVGTYRAHLRNAFKGVLEGHSKKLVVLHSHFPMKIEVKGDTVRIKNFLGGKVDRIAKIVKGAQVKVKGKEIVVEGSDIYAVGQTAANLCQATKVRGRYERVFQDGIYVVE